MIRSAIPDVASLLAGQSDAVAAIFAALRALVREELPGATEQLDLPDNLLAFGFGPPGGVRLKDTAVGLIPYRAHVNVMLADGAELADPAGMIEGTGKRIRHVKCRSLDDIRRPELRDILAEQSRLRRRG